MDFADLLEQLRSTLRSLCTGPRLLPIEDAYGDDIADPDRLARLAEALRRDGEGYGAEAVEASLAGAEKLDGIIAWIVRKPDRPTNEDMCRRYAAGGLDARTVIYLTGWNLETLYDECEKVTGQPAPPAF